MTLDLTLFWSLTSLGWDPLWSWTWLGCDPLLVSVLRSIHLSSGLRLDSKQPSSGVRLDSDVTFWSRSRSSYGLKLDLEATLHLTLTWIRHNLVLVLDLKWSKLDIKWPSSGLRNDTICNGIVLKWPSSVLRFDLKEPSSGFELGSGMDPFLVWEMTQPVLRWTWLEVPFSWSQTWLGRRVTLFGSEKWRELICDRFDLKQPSSGFRLYLKGPSFGLKLDLKWPRVGR